MEPADLKIFVIRHQFRHSISIWQQSFLVDLVTMSLPPEQINIKRRREEEPVDTLCKKFSILVN